MSQLETPVVLFLFKRVEATLRIVDRMRQVQPRMVYLLSDHGRTANERALVEEVRTAVEHAIDWKCTVVRRFHDENVGVYRNIALGAQWVFEREQAAIFLEDDNLPAVSFFGYCEELLQRYANNPQVLWICGTNYLEDFRPKDGSSYVFTQHLLPCGWASWGWKFNRYYDYSLESVDDSAWVARVRRACPDSRLFKQQFRQAKLERQRHSRGEPYRSWDYHIAWSIRARGVYGISPTLNQIENIGVDEFATHGGTSMSMEMTRRFTKMASHEIVQPLVHPLAVMIDPEYERRVGDIIRLPAQRVSLKTLRITTRNALVDALELPEDFSIRERGSLPTALKRIVKMGRRWSTRGRMV